LTMDQEILQKPMLSKEELVLNEKKVAISTSNQRIDPDEYFTEPLFNLILAILKQHSIYNAHILIKNAPEIYMQQFWHIIYEDNNTKQFHFHLDNQ
ncbi:hypothetical protein Tco_1289135, partial [Tanacetum coccineum]